MLPKSTGTVVPVSLRETERPSRTYGIVRETGRISGSVDSLEAVRQAVYCILNTERYDHLIFSWNYGVELKDLYGRPAPFVKSEVKRRIREALLQDKRVRDVGGFVFRQERGLLKVSFTVHSTLGDLQMDKEVAV